MDHAVMKVVAAAVVEDGKLLVVSKQAAPDVFYIPGGKPEAGEQPEETLERELREELGVELRTRSNISRWWRRRQRWKACPCS
ncbi:NUDIX domain-containing protein [Streptomyces sp. KL116D]|uniref:NUDIX domain-containing protein n=1 Tax=Streptomyces sp. KL116D TaxID=3045152 RepID=UPI0035580B46